MHPNSSIPPILTVWAMDHPAYRSVARVPRRTLASFTREESARTIHNIVGRNVASLVPQRTTPRDGNGRDNYLDSGGYMLPSAAWDLPTVVSMVFHGVAGVPVVARTRWNPLEPLQLDREDFLGEFFWLSFSMKNTCMQFRSPPPSSPLLSFLAKE